MTEKTLNIDMDSLLDGTLDDLADIPEFKPYPAGAHLCYLTINGPKKIGEHPAFEITLKAIETLEAAKPDEVVSKDQTVNIAYMMDNEISQGRFKEVLAVLHGHFGGKNNRETIALSQNAQVIALTRVRQGKGDSKDKQYTDIVEIAFQ